MATFNFVGAGNFTSFLNIDLTLSDDFIGLDGATAVFRTTLPNGDIRQTVASDNGNQTLDNVIIYSVSYAVGGLNPTNAFLSNLNIFTNQIDQFSNGRITDLWNYALAGDDSIRLGGVTARAFGDFDTLDNKSIVAGDDVIILTAAATVGTTTGLLTDFAGIFGDVVEVKNNSILVCGDDIIDARLATGEFSLVGDVFLDATAASVTFGNDIIYGSQGDDRIWGDYSADRLPSADGGDDVLFGNAGNDLISGLGGDDVINGGADNDTLAGGTGDDVIIGDLATTRCMMSSWRGGGPDQSGIDRFEGGAGNDEYSVGSLQDILIEDDSNPLTGGIDSVNYLGSGTFTLGANFEVLNLQSSAFASNGTGNGLANTIIGNALVNTLNGAAGDDILRGEDGNDTYLVDRITDFVQENNGLPAGGNDLVIFSGITGTYALTNNVERLILGGASAIGGTGNGLANTITGNNAANVLNGLGGIDTMIGGNGSDTYFADRTNDIITESNAVLAIGGNDLVNFTGSSGVFVLSNNVERLTLGGLSAIGGTGNASANTITGNIGGNTLSGLGGADFLNGKGGNDRLTGGTGADSFVFDTALNTGLNRDTITDFNVADDTIRLENAIFIGLATGTLASTAFKNVTTSGPVDSTDRILYDDISGAVFFDRDGSGATYARVQFATITGAPTLTHLDFVVF